MGPTHVTPVSVERRPVPGPGPARVGIAAVDVRGVLALTQVPENVACAPCSSVRARVSISTSQLPVRSSKTTIVPPEAGSLVPVTRMRSVWIPSASRRRPR